LFSRPEKNVTSPKTPNTTYGNHDPHIVPDNMEQKDKGITMEKKLTVIAEGTILKGNLKSEDSVQIDGFFEGDLEVKQSLIVGPMASIKANINAGEVKISGQVNGNIIAKDRLEILSSGKLFGDIKSPRLTIAEGVVFEGHCSMGNEKKQDSTIPVVNK
jgi:cytoskeletal protein CcmA (bactofilin family)